MLNGPFFNPIIGSELTEDIFNNVVPKYVWHSVIEQRIQRADNKRFNEKEEGEE